MITMKTTIPVFVMGLSIGLVASAFSQDAGGKGSTASVYAEIVYVRGDDVVILSSGRQIMPRDPIGERLSAGDQIQTGNKTSVELVLMPRKARLRLSENTVATIRDLGTDGTAGIDLLYGRLRSKVAKMTEREAQYNVRAPSVVAAVRGTDFGCDVILLPTGKAAPTKVYCFEGSVEVALASANDDAKATVGAGEMAIVEVESGDLDAGIRVAAVDDETLGYWKSNAFTEKMPVEEVAAVASAGIEPKAATIAPSAAALSLEPIRKGIAAKNAAIIGSAALFVAGAALGGTSFFLRDSDPGLSDTLLIGGGLTASLAIPSLILAISINPLSPSRLAGEE